MEMEDEDSIGFFINQKMNAAQQQIKDTANTNQTKESSGESIKRQVQKAVPRKAQVQNDPFDEDGEEKVSNYELDKSRTSIGEQRTKNSSALPEKQQQQQQQASKSTLFQKKTIQKDLPPPPPSTTATTTPVKSSPIEMSQNKKKIPSWKTLDVKKIRILKIEVPEAIVGHKTFKKVKYQIRFKYVLTCAGEEKKQWKTVRFGDVDKLDKVDGELDNVASSKRIGQLKFFKNPMHQHFWTYWLLNKDKDINENYLNLLKRLSL